MTQEQINTLRQEITNVGRQIEILNGPAFADTVPEIGAAKEALARYKQEAERQIAAFEEEQRAAAPAPRPAAPQVDVQALAQNPILKAILQALTQQTAVHA